MTDETVSVLKRLLDDGVVTRRRGSWFETADISRVPEAVRRQAQAVQHITRDDRAPVTRLQFRRRRRVAS